MPGSTRSPSQLDWLSSTTAMIVLSWSKATRDLLKSFSWGIGALRQLFASDDGAISSPPAPYHLSAGSQMDVHHFQELMRWILGKVRSETSSTVPRSSVTAPAFGASCMLAPDRERWNTDQPCIASVFSSPSEPGRRLTA